MFPLQLPASRPHTRATLVTVVGAAIAVVGVLSSCSSKEASTAPPSFAKPPASASPEGTRGIAPPHPPGEGPGPLRDSPTGSGRASSGVADGRLPDGVEPFDDRYPALTRLDPALLGALREAARAAGRDDVTIHVNSGWRSSAYQRRLLDEADSTYGGGDDVARWVAGVGTSPHVSGDAVDVGDAGATTWLSQHGAAYGLCQVYANEPWHYELRPHASSRGCPAMYLDPTHDPRMQQ